MYLFHYSLLEPGLFGLSCSDSALKIALVCCIQLSSNLHSILHFQNIITFLGEHFIKFFCSISTESRDFGRYEDSSEQTLKKVERKD